MIPYVTRGEGEGGGGGGRGGVFTRTLQPTPPRSPLFASNQQSDVVFHLRNPQMDRRIPPFATVNIFSPSRLKVANEGVARRRASIGQALPSPRDLGHAPRRASWGRGRVICGESVTFFSSPPPPFASPTCCGTEARKRKQQPTPSRPRYSLVLPSKPSTPPFSLEKPLLISFHPLVHTDPSHPYLSRGCSGSGRRRKGERERERVPRIFSSGARLSVLVDDVIRV